MYVSPMLLTKGNEPFNDQNYLSELKLDGIRLIYSNMDEPKLYTRHKTDVTGRFPEIINLNLPRGIILDGELILPDENGKPDFEGLMSRFQIRNRDKIKRLSQASPVTFCAFDIPYFKEESICQLPLIERKGILNETIGDVDGQITNVKYLEGQGIPFFDVVKKQGLEGIVLKKKDSCYELGKRTEAWIKIKHYQYGDVYISGCRKKEFGWLISREDGRSAGILEIVPREARQAAHSIANDIKTGEDSTYVYLKPLIKCRIKYLYETQKGFLREPSFMEFVGIKECIHF